MIYDIKTDIYHRRYKIKLKNYLTKPLRCGKILSDIKSLVVFFIYGGDRVFGDWGILETYLYLEILFSSLTLALFIEQWYNSNK